MTVTDNDNINVSEDWEKEVIFPHRWGQHGKDAALDELKRLRKLWNFAKPLDQSCKAIMGQIMNLEICNWNLENSILSLCEAIGAKKTTKLSIGHMESISEERWKELWAYYLTLRKWLVPQPNGYEVLLKICDPDKAIENHILKLLGERNEIKELYVERFCLCLEVWIGDWDFNENSAQMKAHQSAISAIEQEIRERDPEGEILIAMRNDGDGRLQPCNHKAFRRYDIIISSIGVGKWRVTMPMRGTDGFERSATLEKYLMPIEMWVNGTEKQKEHGEMEFLDKIYSLLGTPDNEKIFLASLLVSLLRPMGLAAKKRAQSRI